MLPLATSERTALAGLIQTATQLLPEDNIGQYEKFDSRVSQNHIRVQYDISYLFANRVILTTNRSNFFGACITAATPTMACVKTFIGQFGLKTHRRPLTLLEIDSFYLFYVNRSTSGLVDLVARLLLHPNFLYHVETAGIVLPVTLNNFPIFFPQVRQACS